MWSYLFFFFDIFNGPDLKFSPITHPRTVRITGMVQHRRSEKQEKLKQRHNNDTFIYTPKQIIVCDWEEKR